MTISASAVKELRERSGAGMMECKNALVATEGDLQAGLEHAIRHIAAVDAAESPEGGPRGVGVAGPER